jgi:hypothetical protein
MVKIDLKRILKYCKSNVISAEIKQAIFFDWLFFKKEKDSIMLIEPGILVMFCSLREYPELTMELIEFLDLYSENFDLNRKIEIRNCVKNAFFVSENLQIIGNLKTILLDDKISNDIKKVYEELTQTHNLPQTAQSELVKQGVQKDMENTNYMSNDDSFENENLTQPVKKEDKVNKEINIKKIENDIFIHPDLQKMIPEATINNLINFRTKAHFLKFLKEFIAKTISTYSQNNVIDSKLMNFVEIYSHFANFFLTFFKDEIICAIEMDDENFTIKQVSNEIFFYLFKLNNDKSEKEFKILIDILKKIIEKYPNYFNRLLYFVLRSNFKFIKK